MEGVGVAAYSPISKYQAFLLLQPITSLIKQADMVRNYSPVLQWPAPVRDRIPVLSSLLGNSFSCSFLETLLHGYSAPGNTVDASVMEKSRNTLCFSLPNTQAMNGNGNGSQEGKLRVMGSHDEMTWSIRASGQSVILDEGTGKLTGVWLWNGEERTQEENWARGAVHMTAKRVYLPSKFTYNSHS